MPASAESQQTYECDSLVRLNAVSNLATGSAPICGGTNQGTPNMNTYTDGDGTQYSIQCNTDYSGTVILTANAEDFWVCVNRCTMAGTSCAGVAWLPNGLPGSSNPTQPICQLKSGLGGTQTDGYTTHFAKRLNPPTLANPAPQVSCSPG